MNEFCGFTSKLGNSMADLTVKATAATVKNPDNGDKPVVLGWGFLLNMKEPNMWC